MQIEYSGRFIDKGRVYSSFMLGAVTPQWMHTCRKDIDIDSLYFMYGDKESYIHFRIVEYYVRKTKPMLYNWLREMKISFGGLVGDPFKIYAGHSIKMLLPAGSIEETAFRLCFNVKATNQENIPDTFLQNDAL